jgi:hypothetical protein
MKKGFLTKEQLFLIISVAGKNLTEAANEKDINQIKNWIDYINEQYQTLKEYESE